MNRTISRVAGVLAALTLSATVAVAAPAKCPVCHMVLGKKATDKSTVAVRLTKGGPVMYCCPKCKMPASVLVKKGAKM